MTDNQLSKWLKTSGNIVIGIIGLVTALVGAIRLYRENIDLFFLVLIVIVIGSIWIVGIYLIFSQAKGKSKTDKGKPKYPQARFWALGVIIVSIIILGGVAQSERTRSFVVNAIYGTPTFLDEINISKVITGRSDSSDSYKLAITILNPHTYEVLITHISLARTNSKRACTPFGGSVINFSVSSNIELQSESQSQNSTFAGNVEPDDGVLDGFSIPALIHGEDNSDNYLFSIEFPSAVTLDSNAYTVITIEIPVVFQRSDNGGSVFPVHLPLGLPTSEKSLYVLSQDQEFLNRVLISLETDSMPKTLYYILEFPPCAY